MSIIEMNDAEMGVLVSTWKWRILQAGYKNVKEFCDDNGFQDSQFSLWVNGKQKPMHKNVHRVEEILREKDV